MVARPFRFRTSQFPEGCAICFPTIHCLSSPLPSTFCTYRTDLWIPDVDTHHHHRLIHHSSTIVTIITDTYAAAHGNRYFFCCIRSQCIRTLHRTNIDPHLECIAQATRAPTSRPTNSRPTDRPTNQPTRSTSSTKCRSTRAPLHICLFRHK